MPRHISFYCQRSIDLRLLHRVLNRVYPECSAATAAAAAAVAAAALHHIYDPVASEYPSAILRRDPVFPTEQFRDSHELMWSCFPACLRWLGLANRFVHGGHYYFLTLFVPISLDI